MPISAENRARYPRDWKAIVSRIRDRSGNRCEGSPAYPDCRADNGEPHPITGSRVVLTVAHLGLPAQLPFLLHVAGDAVTDEVVDLVGFLMPLDAKVPEWRAMMHDRATAEVLAGAPACGAGFFVPLPSVATRAAPARPIVFGAEPPSPVWVRLSRFRLLRKPWETAVIATETAAHPFPVSARLKRLAASFANKVTQTALDGAYALAATGRRTSDFTVRNLLRCDWEPYSADGTIKVGRGFAGACHTSLYHFDEYPENCFDENLRHMCQRCHNKYDTEHRKVNRSNTMRSRRAVSELF